MLHPVAQLSRERQACIRVLQLLAEPLLENGYDVIRYNSRGVGSSTGWASFTGHREGEDLKELVQWARTTMPNITSLVIVVCAQLIGLHVVIVHEGPTGLLVWLSHRVPPSCPGGCQDFPHPLVVPHGSAPLAYSLSRPLVRDRVEVAS